MSSEVAINSKQEMAIYAEFGGAGVAEDTDVTDLLIPKMLLQQGLSKRVTDGEARSGEIRDSLTGELLGDKDGPPKVIIFAHAKSWEVAYKKHGETKAKFLRSEPVTVQNATREWEVQDANGVTINQIQHNFTCLYTGRGEIEHEMPYMLCMKTFSVNPAQRLCSFFSKLSQAKRPSFSKVIELIPTTRENEKGKFFFLDWKQGRDATLEEMQTANKWRVALKGKRSFTVHEAGEEAHDVTPPVTGATVARDDEGMQF